MSDIVWKPDEMAALNAVLAEKDATIDGLRAELAESQEYARCMEIDAVECAAFLEAVAPGYNPSIELQTNVQLQTARIVALESQLATLQAATPVVRYAHRNGETEPPTEMGLYWFRGKVDGELYAGSITILQMSWNDELRAFGQERLTPYLGYWTGEWYGPIVAPWDATPVADAEVWEPLTDESSIGVKTSQNPKVGLWIYADGERISASTSEYEIFVDLPDDIRLCQRRPHAQQDSQEVQGGQPAIDARMDS